MEALTRATLTADTSGSLEWAAAQSPAPGESECGDLSVVYSFDKTEIVAVIDGLGHGSEAAEASRIAAATIQEAHAEPLEGIVERCHHRLQGTRGVAMSLVVLDRSHSTMTWLSVGNVEGVLLRRSATADHAREWLLLRGGVVGYKLPPLKASRLPIVPGDVLILATDGIGGHFVNDVSNLEPVAACATRLMARHRKPEDDALALVARYRATP